MGGARIYLALDHAGKEPLEGFGTESDAEGRYAIDTKGLPPALSTDGHYYLVVEKEGYERLIRPIAIGVFSQYIQNTAIMKREMDR